VAAATSRTRYQLTSYLYSVPAGRLLVTGARNLVYGSLDALDNVRGRSGELVPPRRLGYVGAGNFRAVGQEFLGHFRDLGGLRPDHDVLDVGCGIGRMAVPLTGYLSPDSSYHGFDIVPTGVRWCQENISARYPNFHFQVADIYNQRYNPTGSATSENYTFPFPEDSFDFSYATSVFTHMLPADVENYLKELARVIRPGGRVLNTFFLLDRSNGRGPDSDRATIPFSVEEDGYWTVSRRTPEVAIAFEEQVIRALYERHGFEVGEIHHGAWSGVDGPSFQDIVVATRGAGTG
jgi:SAM-dependent methyltransferase